MFQIETEAGGGGGGAWVSRKTGDRLFNFAVSVAGRKQKSYPRRNYVACPRFAHEAASRAKGPRSNANPDVLNNPAMYVVLAEIATGAEKSTCCQPDAVSPLNVAWASTVPVIE